MPENDDLADDMLIPYLAKHSDFSEAFLYEFKRQVLSKLELKGKFTRLSKNIKQIGSKIDV